MPGADNIVSLRQSTLHSVKLPRSFYEQNTIVVAQELLGKYLVREHAEGAADSSGDPENPGPPPGRARTRL